MRERPGESLERVRFPHGDPRPVPILAHRVSCGPLILGYLVKAVPGLRAGSNPAPSGNRCVPRSSLARSTFDGSRNWVIVDNDAVAGSSPASGSLLAVRQHPG
jgi:hypothetical protein